MTAAIIELNDLELRVAQGGSIVARSPAAAIISGNTIEVGESASAKAQLHPREFHNRFWYQLDQAQLRRPTRAARHHADLAFRHLEQLHRDAGKPETVVFAVPGGFSKEQLALLLGLADACQMRTTALVDAAVASAAASVGPGHYEHVDIQLHRTVVTEIEVTDSVERRRVEAIEDAGFDKLNDRLVAFVADQFLAQSRFDPLHQASTEQLLYNEMPAWLALLGTQREIRIHIEFRGSRFEARVARDDVIGIAEPTYARISERLSPRATWLIGDRLAGLPGLVDFHRGCVVLGEQSVFDGCASIAMTDSGPDSGLTLITKLPATKTPTITPAAPAISPKSPTVAATHILSGVRAYALTAAGLYLNADGSVSSAPTSRTVAHTRLSEAGASVAPENGAHVRLNGLTATGSPFGAGDEITIEGATCTYLPISLSIPDEA